MSIASRIESIEEHIGNAYDSIEALGVDITDVDKNIENISSSIEGIYDTLPKVTGEGESITLDGTIKGRLKTTLKGNTSQNGTPTPDTPIPVNVVSGDNSINLIGKNILPTTTDYGLAVGSSGLITNNINRHAYYCEAKENTTYYISRESVGEASYWYYGFTDTVPVGGVTCLSYGSMTENKTQITSPVGTKYIVVFMGSGLSTGVMVSTLDTTYEAYNKDTYNIDLPSGMELCKIGDYQDYFLHDKTLDKWYKVGMVGKLVLDENSGLTSATSSSFKVPSELTANIVRPQSDYYPLIIFSNYLIPITWHENWTGKSGFIVMINSGNDTRIRVYGTETLTELNEWLSTHNIEIYYECITPTKEPVTYQPLIDQLNNIEKAMSYNGQTNISQVNNDLPFIISASALKDWQESNVSTLSMVNPLSLGNTLNTQEDDIQPIEVDNIESLEEE